MLILTGEQVQSLAVIVAREYRIGLIAIGLPGERAEKIANERANNLAAALMARDAGDGPIEDDVLSNLAAARSEGYGGAPISPGALVLITRTTTLAIELWARDNDVQFPE